MSHAFGRLTRAAFVLALLPAAALAQTVTVRSDASASPFPSNRLTVPDFGNQTFRRVNLPKPDCAVRVSDCQDIDVINALDGFSTQPRITVPFTGDIDLSTATSANIFLLNLGDTLTLRGYGDRVGINQVLWDPASKTLVFEPDELLAEHSRYVLVVTTGVRDTAGRPLAVSEALNPPRGWSPHWRGSANSADRELLDAVRAVRLPRGRAVAGASVFTTQSSTVDLIKIMRQIKNSRPAAANFQIGSAGGASVRTVFPLAGVTGIQFRRQNSTTAPLTAAALPLAALQTVPGAVGQVAYGQYSSPSYLAAGEYLPATPTLFGRPLRQSSQTLSFQLFLPAGDQPAEGWPVAIFGHGFGDNMYSSPWTVAGVMASRGIATLSINVVGHGGGAAGVLEVSSAGQVVSLPAGGRGFDQDGNTTIDTTEGVNAAPPRTAIGSRDGLRQTVIDLMQLVRQIEVGMDVDGDSVPDLNPRRIYYTGQSFGGIYGTMLLAVEPSIRAGVPNVPGGSITEVARLGGFRFLTAAALATRQPQLLNLPPDNAFPVPFNLRFNENMPLRDLPPVVNSVPGATDIALVLDRLEWVQQPGNPVSYASLIRRNPLGGYGHGRKSVIFQVARGDQTVPNPTSTAIIRAGGFEAQTTYYRADLAFAADATISKNQHVFLTNLSPNTVANALRAQTQIAEFFSSNGRTVIDPDGAGTLFEVPIAGPLPEALNYIP